MLPVVLSTSSATALFSAGRGRTKSTIYSTSKEILLISTRCAINKNVSGCSAHSLPLLCS